jgi:hypothetical protein
MWPEGLGKFKEFIHLIGTRISALTTMLPRGPFDYLLLIVIINVWYIIL